MAQKPIARQFRYAIESARLGKQMRGAGHQVELAIRQLSSGLPVQRKHLGIQRSNKQQYRTFDQRKHFVRKIGATASRYDRVDMIIPGGGFQCCRGASAGTKKAHPFMGNVFPDREPMQGAAQTIG